MCMLSTATQAFYSLPLSPLSHTYTHTRSLLLSRTHHHQRGQPKTDLGPPRAPPPEVPLIRAREPQGWGPRCGGQGVCCERSGVYTCYGIGGHDACLFPPSTAANDNLPSLVLFPVHTHVRNKKTGGRRPPRAFSEQSRDPAPRFDRVGRPGLFTAGHAPRYVDVYVCL